MKRLKISKRVIRRCNLKERQCNDQWIRDERTNKDLQNSTQSNTIPTKKRG